MTHRPLRFGVRADLRAIAGPVDQVARRAEHAGYSTLTFNVDRGGSPSIVCRSAVEATSTLRVGLSVDIDTHEVATIAGWCAAIESVAPGRAGVDLVAATRERSFERPLVRARRLGDTIDALRGHLDAVPIAVAGTDRPTLTVAAQKADIVGFVDGPNHMMTPAGLDDRVATVRREGTGAELQAIAGSVIVTDDPLTEAAMIAGRATTGEARPQDVLDCPLVLLGSVAEICEQLQERRERYGISYWIFAVDVDPVVDRVVAQLSGG